MTNVALLIVLSLLVGLTFLACWGAIHLYRRSDVLQAAGDLIFPALIISGVVGLVARVLGGRGGLWFAGCMAILMLFIAAFVLCVWAWRAVVYAAAKLTRDIERKRDELRETEQSWQNQLEMQKQDALRRWQEEHASPIDGEQRIQASREEGARK